MRLVRYARREMRRAGDGRTPIWLTELSWPAAKGKVPRPAGFETTDRGPGGPAARPRCELIVRARKALRIGACFWYTWLSSEIGPSSFDWSGLRRLRDGAPVSAPALAVFRRKARRLEGCRKGRRRPPLRLRCQAPFRFAAT